jgi:hypothetical protein
MQGINQLQTGIFLGLRFSEKSVDFQRTLHVFFFGVGSEKLEAGDPEIFSDPMPCVGRSGLLWRQRGNKREYFSRRTSGVTARHLGNQNRLPAVRLRP